MRNASPALSVVSLLTALFFAPSLAECQVSLCPQDSWSQRISVAQVESQTSIWIQTNSTINHSADHPNCRGGYPPVDAEAEMDTGMFSSCTASDGGWHIGTSAARRSCSNLGSGYYRNFGTHNYDYEAGGTSQSSLVYITGNACGGPDGCSSSAYVRNTAYCDDPPVFDDCGCCQRFNSPLILDLGQQGVPMSSAEDGVLFPISGPGTMRWVGWPLSGEDAWLARDRNGSGQIEDASELFGTATPNSSGVLGANGFIVLSAFDINGDSRIDSTDAVFQELLTWRDVNRNGVSEPSELRSLASAGVLSISLDYTESLRRDRWGNWFRYRSRMLVQRQVHEPHQRICYDVYPVTKLP